MDGKMDGKCVKSMGNVRENVGNLKKSVRKIDD
jgi:uncharacterized protein YjbJ (UPF0337 family)